MERGKGKIAPAQTACKQARTIEVSKRKIRTKRVRSSKLQKYASAVM